MALPFRVARAIVAVKAEGTPGTYATGWVAADGFHARNITIKPSQSVYERNVTRSHFGNLDDIAGAAEMEISFEMDMIPGEAAGVAANSAVPAWDVPMIACGHKRVFATGSNPYVTYTPTTTFDGTGTTTLFPSESYSVAVFEENTTRYALKGGIGMVSMSTSQGSPGTLKFTFKGAYVATALQTALAVVDPLVNPPAFLGATLEVHGLKVGVNPMVFDGFDFDKGNVLSKRGDSSDTNGVKGYWITAHNPMIKFAPEMVLVATKDIMGRWKSGSSGDGTTNATGGRFIASWGSTPKAFTFQADYTQWKELSFGEREGGRILDAGLKVTTQGTAADGADYSIKVG